MKRIKVRSIEILTNGCLNFSYADSSKLKQLKINEKDYVNAPFSQKTKKKLDGHFSAKLYKYRYKL